MLNLQKANDELSLSICYRCFFKLSYEKGRKNFNKEFEDTQIQLTYCSSGSRYYNPQRWWETALNRKVTYTEYVKLIGNYFGFSGKKSKELLREFI